LEQRGLAGRRRRAGTAPGLPAGPLGLRLGGGRRPRQLPALLVRDALALLDHQQIDEARQRTAQEAEIPLPVSRRMGQRAHLVEGEGERGAVALAGGQAQIEQDLASADARGRGAGHGGGMLARRRTRARRRQRTRISYSSRGVEAAAGCTVIFTWRAASSRSRSGRPSRSTQAATSGCTRATSSRPSPGGA